MSHNSYCDTIQTTGHLHRDRCHTARTATLVIQITGHLHRDRCHTELSYCNTGHPNYRTPTQRSVSHSSYCDTGHPNYRTPTPRSVSHRSYCDTIQTTGHLHRDRCHTARTATPSKLQDTYTEIGVTQLVLRHHPNYRTPTQRSVSHSWYCDTIQTTGHLHRDRCHTARTATLVIQTTGHLHRDRCHTACTATQSKLQDTYTEIGVTQLVLRHHPNYRTPTPRSVPHNSYCDTIQTTGHLHRDRCHTARIATLVIQTTGHLHRDRCHTARTATPSKLQDTYTEIGVTQLVLRHNPNYRTPTPRSVSHSSYCDTIQTTGHLHRDRCHTTRTATPSKLQDTYTEIGVTQLVLRHWSSKLQDTYTEIGVTQLVLRHHPNYRTPTPRSVSNNSYCDTIQTTGHLHRDRCHTARTVTPSKLQDTYTEIGVTQLVLRHHPNYRTPTQRSVSHRSYCDTGHPNYRTPSQRSVSHSSYCDTIQTTGHLHRDRCHTVRTATPGKLQDTYTEIGVTQLILRHHPNYRTPTPRSVLHSSYCDTIQTTGHLHRDRCHTARTATPSKLQDTYTEIGVTQLVLRHHPNYRTPTPRSVSHSSYCDTIQTKGHLHRDRCYTARTATPSKLQDTYTEIGVTQLVLRHHLNYKTPTPRSVSHSSYCDTIQTTGHLHRDRCPTGRTATPSKLQDTYTEIGVTQLVLRHHPNYRTPTPRSVSHRSYCDTI